jgi:hypothetical protein
MRPRVDHSLFLPAVLGTLNAAASDKIVLEVIREYAAAEVIGEFLWRMSGGYRG